MIVKINEKCFWLYNWKLPLKVKLSLKYEINILTLVSISRILTDILQNVVLASGIKAKKSHVINEE